MKPYFLVTAPATTPALGAGWLLEVDPLILSGMIVVFFLHEATATWDVPHAVTAREGAPGEQHVHSVLKMVPLLALELLPYVEEAWRDRRHHPGRCRPASDHGPSDPAPS
jgi:hypothetical protein